MFKFILSKFRELFLRWFRELRREKPIKKAWVSRVAKNGNSVTLWITTITDKGVEKVIEMKLKDNVPIDEYSII